MTKYCKWCAGKIPYELELCSGCLMLSSEFMGTDVRPFLSEKRNKEINRFLKPGRGLKIEQRIRHLVQEVNIPISIPPILKSKRKDSRAHWNYESSEWDELVDYWRRFNILRPGNYYFPDGTPLSIEKDQRIFINRYRLTIKIPILDIAEWLSNPFRINSIKNWSDFILLLDCVTTPLPPIDYFGNNEEKWGNWIKENSWRGIDYPMKVPSGHYINTSRVPPFLEFIERKHREEGDTRCPSEIIRENIQEMKHEDFGMIGELWTEIYYCKDDYNEEYRVKSIPILVTQNHRLKILVIDRNKPSTCSLGNDPRDWRKLMVCALLPNRSRGSEFIQGLLMNWSKEFELWKPSLRQIKSARLLHDEIEKLNENSSLIPINYNSEKSGLKVQGFSGINYVISSFGSDKLKVDAIQSIRDIDDVENKGLDLCIDPLIEHNELPFGDIAVGYLLALRNDISSRNYIFTLDFFLNAIDDNTSMMKEDNYWLVVEHDYHAGLESIHGHHEMDENMERAIAEYENDLEIQRQQQEFEQQQHEFEQQQQECSNGMIDEILQEMDMEARFEYFCDLIEQNKNGEQNE